MIPVLIPNPFADADEVERLIAPEFQHHSPFDWGVLIYGGENPRTGFPQPPLEFQFFGRFYSRKQIEQKAADLCEREFRTSYRIQEPGDKRFMRSRAA